MTDVAQTKDQKVAMEDWLGSDLDKYPLIELRRAFNGVIVTRHDYSRDRGGETLVFQDMEKLRDWLSHWHKSTKRGTSP